MDLCLNRIRLRPVIVAFLQSFEWSGEPGIAIVPGMMTPNPAPRLTPLRPVSRRHLLQLQVAPVTLRPFQRADLPAWRLFDDRRRRGRHLHSGIDEEARFLAHMHRSRLEQDNDQLMLGVFDDQHGIVLDQLHVRLHSLHSRCAELLSLQHWHAHTDAMLQALCPFLFEDVGLHRLFVMLPPDCNAPFTQALRTRGFEQEGVLRDQHFGLDGWQDRQLLALTAPIWRSQHQAGD
ncbi:GNAT family N-acetyltransferase [Stenotrophomonas maltophilia]|nr:GNAT family N-acetyltransferase [Stenotrophomonas maltophilia]MBA0344453.1 GNAT family N-acetyltransferase [Stenotrophomonas maltophilia]MBA0356493.1 GNAT family N-acetyltransferase [Stenotrophomonas maltophilia]MBA0518229.1 GNAT family N-acetyltransferase [Stenotrophomonas maltophilia]